MDYSSLNHVPCKIHVSPITLSESRFQLGDIRCITCQDPKAPSCQGTLSPSQPSACNHPTKGCSAAPCAASFQANGVLCSHMQLLSMAHGFPIIE